MLQGLTNSISAIIKVMSCKHKVNIGLVKTPAIDGSVMIVQAAGFITSPNDGNYRGDEQNQKKLNIIHDLWLRFYLGNDLLGGLDRTKFAIQAGQIHSMHILSADECSTSVFALKGGGGIRNQSHIKPQITGHAC